MAKKYKGLWLYGISGSGKSYTSKYLKSKIKNSFLVDGDKIREINNNDLGHTIKDRKKQLNRLLKLSNLIITEGYFPIVSSVYLDKKTYEKLKKHKIKVIEILREKNKINMKLEYKKNVIGKDLKLPKLNTLKLFNDKNFKKNIKKNLFN